MLAIIQHATAGEAQYRAIAHAVFFFRITTDLVVAHHIQKRNNVGPARQVLQDLDLALYLLLLDGLEDLDDAFLVVDDVDALKNFRVLSAAWPVKVSLGSTATGQARAPILRTTS